MISLTELAARKVQQQLDRRGKGLGIRIGIKTTGCSGYAYALEYVDNADSEDLNFTSHGITVFVSPKSLVFVEGLLMDWKRNGLNEGFDFINPKEKDRCGCGESFRI